MSIAQCGVATCDQSIYQAGLCCKHYQRKRRGMPYEYKTKFDRRTAVIENDIAKIPLGVNAKDGYAIVDKEYSWLDRYNWHMRKGYAHTKSIGSIHRFIMGVPDDKFIDHINHDRLDNRLSNLRIATESQNMANISITSKHGYKGVFNSPSGRWYSQVRHNGKKYHIGTFNTKQEAALAYNKMAKELHGEFAVLNDIQEVGELLD